MTVTQFGTTLAVGGQSTATLFSSYIVETDNDNEVEADEEMMLNADGLPCTKLIYSKLPVRTFNLIAKSDAVPLTDFPPKARVAAGGSFSGWFCDSAPITRAKNPTKITVRLISLGF
jgi:hypothetical protein